MNGPRPHDQADDLGSDRSRSGRIADQPTASIVQSPSGDDGIDPLEAVMTTLALEEAVGKLSQRHISKDADEILKGKVKGDVPDPEGPGAETGATGSIGTFFSYPLVQAIGWAGLAFGAGQLLGGIIGFDKDNTLALSTALAAGTLAGKGILAFAPKIGSAWAGAIGVGVGALIFVAMYKDSKTETVSFDCMPWQPPVGSDSCEVCNDEDGLPCSEYRCRSLGQNCELVNYSKLQHCKHTNFQKKIQTMQHM